MKYSILVLFLVILSGLGVNAQVSITTDNSTPDSSAILDIQSIDKGVLIPRMTAAERDAISAPANGLMVYVTTDSSFYYYEGNAWAKVGRQGWGLTGNAGTVDGTNFIGTTDDVILSFRVNNKVALRIQDAHEPGAEYISSPNIIGGVEQNAASGYGNTIAGGGSTSAWDHNQISGLFGVISGGTSNRVNGYFSTVSGGLGNTAGGTEDDASSTVSGGESNMAKGIYSTVPGGYKNQALGDYSFAAGRRARIAAAHDGSFLFADGTDLNFNSATSNEFAVRANGGFRFVTETDNNGNPTKTVSIDNTGTVTAPAFVGDGSGLTGIPGIADNLGNHIATQTLDLNNQDMINGDTVIATAFFGDGSGLTNLPTLNSWGLTGNAGTVEGTNFIGTTDNVSLDFRVNNTRALRLEYAEYSPGSPIPNFISGAPSNSVSNGIYGATIAGGGGPNGYTSNEVNGNWGTVVGGIRNEANSIAAVVGGEGNHADGDHSIVLSGYGNNATGTFSTIVGGDTNTASGSHSTAIGGTLNIAGGSYSLAAGNRAQANNDGSFVFADKQDFDFSSTQTNEFSVRATGGVRLVTAIDGNGAPTQTVSIDNSGTVTAAAFVGDGSGLTDITVPGDNLGDHMATQNINLNNHYLSGDGDSEGVYVKGNGNVGIGTSSPNNKFTVSGNADFTGNVGIGITTPNNKLTVSGNADFTGNVGIGITSPGDVLQLKTGGIRFTDSEIANTSNVSGVLMFDENYYASGEIGNGYFNGNGGGLGFKNEDGWGALISTANMQWLKMDLNSLHVGGTSDPGEDNLVVDGVVKIGGGSPGNGKVLTSDATGNAIWKPVPVDSLKVSKIPSTYNSGNNDDLWRDLSDGVTQTFSFENESKNYKIEANQALRLTAGTGIDPFEIRVKVKASCSGITLYTNVSSFTPPEGQSDHDNFLVVPYLDVLLADEIPCTPGTLTFTLQVRNTGDDIWESKDRILMVTPYL